MSNKNLGRLMATKKVSAKVSKVEDEQLRDYELILIISPEVADETLDTTIDNINNLVTGKGGVISSVERWGKRKLAYPIRHFPEGNYVLTQLKLKPTLNKDLDASLQISEEVLRHLLIKVES
jgi:small subunit ribosomal protein S6